MSVGRSYTFTLDEATLSGGAAIVAAGSGLPRRITGAIDYEARVLALNPSGYWPLNEPTNGPWYDRTANGRTLTGNYQQQKVGPIIGGSQRYGITYPPMTGTRALTADGIYPEHALVAGTPFSLFVRHRTDATSQVARLAGNQTAAGFAYNPGWSFTGPTFYVANGVGAVAVSIGFPYNALVYHTVLSHVAFAVTYTGAPLNQQASWRIYRNGVSLPLTFSANVTTTATAGRSLIVNEAGSGAYGCEGDLAIWNNRALTQAEVQSLSSAVPCGRAVWTLPAVAASRTLKGFQLPGRLARNDATRLGVRARYDIGGGEIEFDPGDDLSVVIPAGQVVSLIADLTHYDLEDLPYIGDDLGGGPVALYEEADPAVNVMSVHSDGSDIQVTLSSDINTVAAPTSDPGKVQIESAIAEGAVLSLDLAPVPDDAPGRPCPVGAEYEPPPAPPIAGAVRHPAAPIGGATRI